MAISGFQKLISTLDPGLLVLDVGSGGLEGENTTEYLAEHFDPKNITGICSNEHQALQYLAQRKERRQPDLNIIIDDFYNHGFEETFDLIVLDLNIDNNIAKDWTSEGLESIKCLLKPEGVFINYIMTTDQYGDPETPQLIRDCWKKFYGSEEMTSEVIGKRMHQIPGFKYVAHEVEERRPYIMWMMLQKV